MGSLNDLTIDDVLFLNNDLGFEFVIEDGEIKDVIY